MFASEHGTMVRARVNNEGSRPARDVRILFGGTGMAEVLSGPALLSVEPPFGWTNAVALGDISAESGVELLIWPSGIQFWAIDPATRLTVVHANGTAHLYRTHEFLGRIADFSFWYDRLGWWQKAGMWAIAFVVVFVAIRVIAKKGYPLWKLRKRTPDLGDKA